MSIKTTYDENGNLRLIPTDPADDYVTIPLLQYEALMDHKNKEKEVITIHEINTIPHFYWVCISLAGWIVAGILAATIYHVGGLIQMANAYPTQGNYKDYLKKNKKIWNDFFVYKKQGGELTYAEWRKENN